VTADAIEASSDRLVDVVRLRARTTGDGPPLLLVVGVGGNIEMWRSIANS
jgi:hypothetical protein